MTTFTASGQPPRLIQKAELHGFVAIALRRPQLEHVARAREAVVAPVGNADTHALQAIADGVVDRYS